MDRKITHRVDLGDTELGEGSGPATPSLGLTEHGGHSAHLALGRSRRGWGVPG